MPHDLRRTAATMCGELEGVSDAAISLCLDHQANKDENGKPLPTVTRKHYNLGLNADIAPFPKSATIGDIAVLGLM
jgi:hypothetical protein